jgi:DNA helicase II / ATP-dependent DNA helicase PcrA
MSVYLAAFNRSIADELQFRLTQRNTTFRPNDQQKNVILWGLTGDGSCNVIARAGCGKSSLLLELARQVDTRHYASTFHSIGLKIWRESHRSEIDGKKVQTIARSIFPWDLKLAGLVAQTVSFAKLSGFGIPLNHCPEGNEVDWATLIDLYGIDDEVSQISTERFVSECMKVYKKSVEMCVAKESVVDFDDMLLAPLLFSNGKKPSAQYDWVFVDEAQDVSATRRILAQWILKPGGRMVAVGDPRQSCYFFAGASSNAMDLIKADMGSIELPLNVTYRCPSKIVTMAQQWVPDFTAHPSAPEGTIRTIDHSDFWMEKFNPDTDAILCRNTRPLVGIAMRLRESWIACVVEGQSGQAIINLVTKWGDIPVTDFLTRMGMWEDEQTRKWTAKGRLDKVEGVNDRCGTVRALAMHMGAGDTTRRLVQKVEMLFGQDNRQDVLRLCTIHRSKGREWDRVFLIGRNQYQPSRYAETMEEKAQEDNLVYVAITRVKRELVEVTVPGKGSRDQPEWWEL